MTDPQISVVLTDRNRQLIWCSPEFLIMTGYSFKELVGIVPGRLLQGNNTEVEKVNRLRSALRKAIPVKETITNYRKNGEQYPCSLVIYPIFEPVSGELINFIAYEVDGDKVNADDLSIMNLREKYQSSSLSPQLAAEIYVKLTSAIDQYVYLNPELTLALLAEQFATNQKYLSQVIHENFDMNFNRFINKYRVKHCKKLINSGSAGALTIEAIGLESGFNSRTAFYSAFRLETGETPGEYLNRID
ncbi:MAG: helix-turn-helix domain-containing protein [Bacteroidota bacterium]